jgi:FdhE protein
LLFDRRAKRLAAWADGHPMADFLEFLSHLAAAQHRAAAAIDVPVPPDPSMLSRRLAGRMPLLPREAAALDGQWRRALAVILEQMSPLPLPSAARLAMEQLAAEEPSRQDARAAGFLLGQWAPDDLAAGLFVAAALQVAWVKAASALDPAIPRPLEPAGLCPVCGSAPVGAVVLAAEPLEGVRYLGCGLCGTQWHFPRAHCSSCGSDRDMAYLSLDGQASHVRGETCGDCRTYLKVFDEAKSPGAEPFVDDLASAGLDLRLAEDGWHRATANPFLMAVPG